MSPANPKKDQRRRWRVGLIGGGGALVLFFALGEAVTRSLNLVDRLNGFPRQLYRATEDPDLPYVLRASLETTARGEKVAIDENGMRVAGPGREEAEPRARRVLLLGDSVVFGFRLPFEETLGTKLQTLLGERTGRPHKVLNGGVEGYNSVNQLAWLQKYGLALEPDLIVVVLNLNDYDYGPVMGVNGVLTTDRNQRVSTWSLANLSDFYVLLRWLYKIGLQGPSPTPASRPNELAPAPFNDFDLFVSALRKRFYRELSDDRWPAMVAALTGLHEESSSRGIPLLIAILPDGDQIGVETPDLIPQQRLLAVCRREELDCLDLYGAFQTGAPASELFLDIMHPNATGHTLVAQALAKHLDEEIP